MADLEKTVSTEQDIIEQQKKAVNDLIAVRAITAENATFARTSGGFVSMDHGDKHYARVSIHRCFPHSDPTHYISIREPDGDGREIGLIEDITALPREVQEMLQRKFSVLLMLHGLIMLYSAPFRYYLLKIFSVLTVIPATAITDIKKHSPKMYLTAFDITPSGQSK